jgi:hypothetical protein
MMICNDDAVVVFDKTYYPYNISNNEGVSFIYIYISIITIKHFIVDFYFKIKSRYCHDRRLELIIKLTPSLLDML